jgi:hypothetical protein
MRFFWDEIQKLAKAHHIEDPLDNLETFRRFLEFWWSRKFNRPLKDPLLQTYTLEELAYEWLRNTYTIPEHDPRKEMEKKVAEDDDMEWIRSQLKKHIEEKAAEPVPVPDEAKPSEPEESQPLLEAPDIKTDFE